MIVRAVAGGEGYRGKGDDDRQRPFMVWRSQSTECTIMDEVDCKRTSLDMVLLDQISDIYMDVPKTKMK